MSPLAVLSLFEEAVAMTARKLRGLALVTAALLAWALIQRLVEDGGAGP